MPDKNSNSPVTSSHFPKQGELAKADNVNDVVDSSNGDALSGDSEVELATAIELLKKEIVKNQTILRNSSDGIHILDQDGNLVELSDFFCNMLGYSRNEMLGMNVSQWDAHFTDPQELMSVVRRRFQIPEVTRLETKHRRKDGTIIDVEISGFPFELDGKPVLFNSSRDITERKALESSLQQERRLNASILKLAGPIILVVDKTGVIVSFNNTAEELTGCSFEDVRGKPYFWRNFLLPEERSRVEQKFSLAMAGKLPSQIENYWINKDGEKRLISWSNSLLTEVGGNVSSLIAIGTDITERRRAEVAMQLLGDITQKAAAGIALVKPDGTFHYTNTRFEGMFGYAPGELLGKSVSILNAPTERSPEETAKEILSALERNGSWSGEILNRKKDGTNLWTTANVSSFQHPELGTLLIAHQTDITERKLNEKVLNEFSQEIEDLYDHAPCGYHSIDAEGIIVRVNQTELDWLGYTREEMVGKPVTDFLTPASQQAVRGVMDAFIKVGHVHGAEREFVRKDGTILQVQINSTAIYDEDGKFLMSRSILTDITERKKVEEELRIAGAAFESQEGMMVTDADGRILRVNEAFAKITGYSAMDVIGRNPRILQSGQMDAQFYESMWKNIKNDGFWSGEIWNRRKSGEIFPEQLTITAVKDDEGRVTNYVGSILDITDRKISEAQILQLAYYDHLTGLPNRRLFRDRLEQDVKRVTRNKSSLALLFIDLDRFKEINDTLGHDKGDVLLIEAARRIRQHVRDTDTFARLGGDEFTIILPEYGEISSIERVVKSVVRDLAMPFDLGNGDVGHISGSVGIALYPQDAENFENLLKHADQAMYAAKQAGRNGFSYFTRSMQQEATEKNSLINDLHLALEQNQLEVYFQPIVDALTGEIVKAEALLRWHHPDHGMIQPGVFIPIAEESGLILEIGEWVFEETLKVITKWQEHTGHLIQVSVNKSPAQFTRSETHPWLEHYLGSHLPKNCIAVEITEGLLLSESEKVKQDFIKFREKGIELSIDDFGTGFSALSYLNRFDVDYLKIDRTFVQKMTTDSASKSLTEAIILMAHKLGIKTIAEGVETVEQRDLLISFDCDYMQGFLYSKPIPASEFEKMLVD